MPIKDQLPELVSKGEDTMIFEKAEKKDAFDLLISAMYQEITQLRYCWSTKKKKASQDFILECFRELMAAPERGR